MSSTSITAADFQNLTGPFILDIRTPAEFHSETLDHCTSLPLQELNDAQLQNLLSSHPKLDAIYLLCQSGARAEMALQKLNYAQHPRLIIIEGGLNALKQQGIKTKLGARSSISLERQVRIAAGSLVLTGMILGYVISSSFFALSAFIGAGLIFAGVTNTCGMGMALGRMPWNNRK